MKYDLHTHSTASDGTCTPSENVLRALEKGLSGIALTDHDTVSGISEGIQESEKHNNFLFVPGIEISTKYNGQDIHVLGYYINYEDDKLLKQLHELRNVRDQRNALIIEKLQHLGIAIEHDELEKKRRLGGNVGRGHIAELLMEKGVVKSLPEAFELYLGNGAKAYAMVERIPPAEAVEIIRRAGGAAVLAHPGIYQDCDHLIKELAAAGLNGLECWHSDHSDSQRADYFALAKTLHLIPTAGSDFHGFRNGQVFHGDLGSCYTGFETISQLKAASEMR
ncbi:PHP domain-containing protein [Fictibacillus aquaticus]|uniref:Polymerase/histidinol phosphatase N-terminal domain-containing protein n=1 Tax=Fictibacillus aquaticus TaxID=2021314 RepID=A0A235FD48_9BACL|nr:PHP domain-containing protein [Fictibacillus aquaticus]OYD58715.1 hypothetical protein CGZ90_02100 [Fictibacillus aquaticus]